MEPVPATARVPVLVKVWVASPPRRLTPPPPVAWIVPAPLLRLLPVGKLTLSNAPDAVASIVPVLLLEAPMVSVTVPPLVSALMVPLLMSVLLIEIAAFLPWMLILVSNVVEVLSELIELIVLPPRTISPVPVTVWENWLLMPPLLKSRIA